jgi:hypothetical protein
LDIGNFSICFLFTIFITFKSLANHKSKVKVQNQIYYFSTIQTQHMVSPFIPSQPTYPAVITAALSTIVVVKIGIDPIIPIGAAPNSVSVIVGPVFVSEDNGTVELAIVVVIGNVVGGGSSGGRFGSTNSCVQYGAIPLHGSLNWQYIHQIK